MIQTLPLLPPDWGAWKWDEGNLSATTEQTQQSYQTLIEKGLCANFSRFVWNDIVDLTANALEAAEIPWDSRYGSVESCKITEQMGVFMANMFNGVATNINRLGLFRWKWEVNYKDQSYLGRPYVNGASTHGEKADNIYAMYILELVKRLNWFLSVLKDEANFAEQISTNESRLTIHPKFTSLVTAPSRSCEDILSSTLANARTLQVAPHKSLVYGSNLNDAELLARVVAAADTESLSTSSVDAVSRVIYTLSLRVASMFVHSMPYTVLNSIPTMSLTHDQKSTTSVFAKMEAGLRELLYKLSALSHSTAQFTASQDTILCADPLIETWSPVVLTSDQPSAIFFNEQAVSLAPSILNGLETNYFTFDAAAASYIDTEIGLKRVGTLRGDPFMVTTPNGKISTAMSSAGWFSEASRSNIIAKSKIAVSKSARYINEIIARYTEEFRAGRSVSFDISQYSNVTIAADMKAKRIAAGSYIASIESYLTQLRLVSAGSVHNTSQVCANGYIDVSLEDGIPHPVGSTNASNSFRIASATMNESERVSYAESSISLIKAGVKLNNSKKNLSVIVSESGIDGELSFATGMKYASVKIACNSYAVMENGAESEDGYWYDPVQTGSNLYIRQTYEDPIQTGTDLDISYVFFEPVVDGSNLHIISAASFGGE